VIVASPRKGGGSSRPPFRRSGISLLEVMLALAIFLMALTAIGQLVDGGTDKALEAQAQATATRLAQSKLAEVEAGVIALGSSASGSFDVEPDWQWQVDMTQETAPNLYTVNVHVSRQLKNKQFEVTLSQMMFDPQQMGNASQAQPPQTTSSGSGTTGTSGTTSGGSTP
jgi:type II secretion system protein I